jgi:carboxylesterase type B
MHIIAFSTKISIVFFETNVKARYAAHGWDMYGIFGAIKEFYTPTKADDDFETTIRREIIHFAKSGTPYSKSWKSFSIKFLNCAENSIHVPSMSCISGFKPNTK